MNFMILNKLFHENRMVLKPSKCHYILITDDNRSYKIFLSYSEIASSNEE